MIDFDQIVLNPLENIFSIVCKFTFAATKPEAAPVTVRGIYSSGPYRCDHAGRCHLFRSADFAGYSACATFRDGPVPDRGDLVEIVDSRHPAFGNRYWIGDSDLDGQGGAMLMLRTQEPL